MLLMAVDLAGLQHWLPGSVFFFKYFFFKAKNAKSQDESSLWISVKRGFILDWFIFISDLTLCWFQDIDV